LVEAKAVVAELRDSRMASVRLLEAESLRAQAWFHVATADRVKARLLLENAVMVAAQTGDTVWETAALHDLARLDFARGALDRLTELAGTIEGPLVQARLAHVRAKVEADTAALSAVSVEFERIGAILVAAEAAADCARFLRRGGLSRDAGHAERRSAGLAARCEGATTPALSADAGVRATLAPRQLDIALLAAKGVPNKQIAARLGISLRTVENRLHETYSVLGITGRTELTDALNRVEW
jgi:DNA-binding NarL/FixJ family response regulator